MDDVVIDLVGVPDLLAAMVAVLKPGGRVTSTVLPPEMQGVAALGIEGKTTARYTADHRFPEIGVRIAEGSLRIPAIQAFTFDHIQDAVALQATRHVRGKIAVQLGLTAHTESEPRGSRSGVAPPDWRVAPISPIGCDGPNKVDQASGVRVRPMATGCLLFSFWDIAITRLEARRTTMHPFGMYLAITDSQREHGRAAADARRPGFARVDATPLVEPEPVTRIGRLVAILRRRVSRTANA